MKIMPFEIVIVTKQNQVTVSCLKAMITLFHRRTQHTKICFRRICLPQAKGIAEVLSLYIKIKSTYHAF